MVASSDCIFLDFGFLYLSRCVVVSELVLSGTTIIGFRVTIHRRVVLDCFGGGVVGETEGFLMGFVLLRLDIFSVVSVLYHNLHCVLVHSWEHKLFGQLILS